MLICKENILKICAALVLSKKCGTRRIKFELKKKKRLIAVKCGGTELEKGKHEYRRYLSTPHHSEI